MTDKNSENEEYEYDDAYVKTRIRRNKQERSVRRTNMWLRRTKVFLRFCTILLLIFICYKLIRLDQWYMSPDAFDSMESPYLEIVNNKIVPDYYILAALRKNEVPKVPIYMFNTDEIKKSIMELPPVENVYIRRFWFPARLQIIVIERTPIVTISPNIDVPPIAFFSADGKLIGREYMPLADDYETVAVITYGSGDDYRNWSQAKVNDFRKLANLVKAETGEDVEYIDYRNPKDVYIKVPTTNIRLGSLNPSIFDKIGRLPSLLPQVKMINKKVKYVDLRWESSYIKLDE